MPGWLQLAAIFVVYFVVVLWVPPKFGINT